MSGVDPGSITVVLVVNHPFQVPRRHVQHQTDAGRHALEEPNMGDGHRQLDVAHALAADPRERHFHPATVADHAPMLDAFVLAAGAFPIFDRAEDTLAEQAALFGLECAVIDRLGILDLALGPGSDRLRRSDGDGDVLDEVDLVEAE